MYKCTFVQMYICTIVCSKCSNVCDRDMILFYNKFIKYVMKIPRSLGKPVDTVSLFDQKNVKGWWPCYCDYDPSIPRELTVSQS